MCATFVSLKYRTFVSNINIFIELQAENSDLQMGPCYQFVGGWGGCVYLKRLINFLDISPSTYMIQIYASTYHLYLEVRS